MANKFINARTIVAFIDVTTPITTIGTDVTPADFEMVACLQNLSFEGTTSPIEATSKCSGSFAESVDGSKAWTISMDGLSIETLVGDTRYNHNKLFKLWKSGAAFWVMIADAANTAASLTIRYGVGRIDTDSEAFPDNDAQTFSISITGIGEVFDQDDLATAP